MTTKHEIEIPDLPEGWRAVAYRKPVNGRDHTLSDDDDPFLCMAIDYPCLIVEKIKPRRIVLEETSEVRKASHGEYYYHEDYGRVMCWPCHMQTEVKYKIWRVVEEE